MLAAEHASGADGCAPTQVQFKRGSDCHAARTCSIAMRFRQLRFSIHKAVFCSRFHAFSSGAFSATNIALKASPELAGSDQRLEIFSEQKLQRWNACKLLDTSIVVNVAMPGNAEMQASLTFDAKSPQPTPAHVLSLLPDSMKCVASTKNSAISAAFAPIVAAVNGRLVGLGASRVCLRSQLSPV
jgi:hypothetical protein